MFNHLNEIRVRTIIKGLIVPLMYVCYIVFPIWLLIGDPLLDALFVFLVIFILPVVIWVLIDKIHPNGQKTIHIMSIFEKQKENLLYFFGTLSIFWTALFLLLNSPLVPRGDEPSHVARIIYAAAVIAFRGRLDPIVTGFLIIGLLVAVPLLLIFIASPRREKFLHRLVTFLTSMRVRSFLLLCVGIVLSYQAYQTYLWSVNVTLTARFGPLHPLLFSLPHLLFGYSDATVLLWRTLNVILMVFTALVIRMTTLEILNRLNHDEANSLLFRIIASLAGWIFLLFPPVVEFSSQIWLSSGVSLFFILSFYSLVRILNAADPDTRAIYFILLSLFLGLGSLWKRVILVEAAAIFLFLLVYYSFRRPIMKKEILNSIFAGIIYACIFLPWLIVVQFGGSVERAYIMNIEYAFPPYLWDYLQRFGNQMGIVFGIAGYACIAFLFLFSIYKREGSTLSMALIFAIWYLFFNLDDGWPHDVDRFFIPVLSLMAISTLVITGLVASKTLKLLRNPPILSESSSESFRFNPKTRKLPASIVVIFLFATIGVGVAENVSSASAFISTSLETRYIPYDPAAEYIDSIIQGNASALYSRFGPSSLSFYLNRYGNYPLTTAGIGVTWSPDPANVTTAAFIDYLKSMRIRVLALPSSGLVSASALPGFIVDELIINYPLYGISSMMEFTLGERAFYVWIIDYVT